MNKETQEEEKGSKSRQRVQTVLKIILFFAYDVSPACMSVYHLNSCHPQWLEEISGVTRTEIADGNEPLEPESSGRTARGS